MADDKYFDQLPTLSALTGVEEFPLWTPPGPGGSSQKVDAKTLALWSRKMPCILDYGADPTDTHDSTGAFPLAFAEGNSVLVPDGTYAVASGPFTMRANQKLIGFGESCVLSSRSALGIQIGDPLNPDFDEGIAISNLVLNGALGVGIDLIKAQRANHLQLFRVALESAGGHALISQACFDGMLFGSKIRYNAFVNPVAALDFQTGSGGENNHWTILANQFEGQFTYQDIKITGIGNETDFRILANKFGLTGGTGYFPTSPTDPFQFHIAFHHTVGNSLINNWFIGGGILSLDTAIDTQVGSGNHGRELSQGIIEGTGCALTQVAADIHIEGNNSANANYGSLSAGHYSTYLNGVGCQMGSGALSKFSSLYTFGPSSNGCKVNFPIGQVPIDLGANNEVLPENILTNVNAKGTIRSQGFNNPIGGEGIEMLYNPGTATGYNVVINRFNGVTLTHNVLGTPVNVIATSNGVTLASGASAWAAISSIRNKRVRSVITEAEARRAISHVRTIRHNYRSDKPGAQVKSSLVYEDLKKYIPEAAIEVEVTDTRVKGLPKRALRTKRTKTQRMSLSTDPVVPYIIRDLDGAHNRITELEKTVARLEKTVSKLMARRN